MNSYQLRPAFIGLGIVFLCLLLWVHSHSEDKIEIQSSDKKIEIPVVVESKPLLFIGDIMLGRYVETLMKTNGTAYPFGDLDQLLGSHTTIANLEGPIPEVHRQTPLQGFQFSFPSITSSVLKVHGVAAVSLANNHSMDWGHDGYENTKKALNDAGVYHFGSYYPAISDYFETKLGTTTVIVYGINMITDSWSENQALEVTKKVRTEHPNAYLITFIHWGEEYNHKQSIPQRDFAHKLIDLGVDCIIGSHPHVAQGIEVYKEKPIFYSLGNYIFDQYFSVDTQRSYGVSIKKEGGKVYFGIIPFVSSRSQVSVATDTGESEILNVIADNSSPLLRSPILKKEISIDILP